MPWSPPGSIVWDDEPLDYIESVSASVRSDLLSAIDRYTDHGLAEDVRTWQVSPARIVGVLTAERHEVCFYVEMNGDVVELTITDIYLP